MDLAEESDVGRLGVVGMLTFAHGDHGDSVGHEPSIWWDVILVSVNVILLALAIFLAVRVYRVVKRIK